MDVRVRIGDIIPDISLCVALSTPCTHFVAGFESGFKLFMIDGQEVRCPPNVKGKGIGIIQTLEKTNAVALVGGGVLPMWNPNRVVVYDMDDDKPMLEIPCLSPVRGVRLTHKEVIIMLDNEVRRYGMFNRVQFKSAHPTAHNPYGLCALAENRIVAFPGQSVGQVQIVHLDKDDVNIIPAHSGALRAIALSPNGRLLATASDKGTIIRVWSTTTGAKVCEFRRGWDQAVIYSIAINPSNTMLASTSDKGTLHVYDIPRGSKASASSPSTKSMAAASEGAVSQDSEAGGKGKWGSLGKIGFLPQYFRDEVSFASTQFWMDNLTAKHDNFGTSEKPGLEEGNSSSGTTVEGRIVKGQLPRGILGWTADDACVVLGCGILPRVENFAVVKNQEGQRVLKRTSWDRYAG